MPFLCVITPIFEGCAGAFHLLVEALQQQTMGDFIHVAVSNGPSPSIGKYISLLKDTRFIYEECPLEPTNDLIALLTNLGKRRNHCLKKFDADRYVFLDADLKITDNTYFQRLFDSHSDAPVIITHVMNGSTKLPKFPARLGSIDISNYSFNRMIAKTKDYPMNVDYAQYRYANDFRFYEKLAIYPQKIISAVCAIKDGNKSYTRITDMATDYSPRGKKN